MFVLGREHCLDFPSCENSTKQKTRENLVLRIVLRFFTLLTLFHNVLVIDYV